MQIKSWKTLKRKIILQHPRLELVEDIVELPNGKKTEYVLKRPGQLHSVAIIAVNQKREILIQKEYNYPPNKVMWQLPGGGMLPGEDTIVAAKRELLEESDLKAGRCEILGYFYVDNRRSDEKQYVVLCQDLEIEAGNRDEAEFIESHWVARDRLAKMIAGGDIDNVYLMAALNLFFTSNSQPKL